MRKLAWPSVVLLALSVPALGAAQSAIDALRPAVSARYPRVHWVDAPTLARWMASAGGVHLLDARAEDEFRVSHLRGARRVDPDDPDVSALRVPRTGRVVVYCSVGWRSAAVADALQRAGYADVHNLEGGIFGWANGGRRVVRGGHAVRAVHPFDETWGRMLRPELRAYRPAAP